MPACLACRTRRSSGEDAAFALPVDAMSGNIMCGYCASGFGDYAAVSFVAHE